MKHARTDTNYPNLISMHSVGFEQTFMKFTEIFVPQE